MSPCRKHRWVNRGFLHGPLLPYLRLRRHHHFVGHAAGAGQHPPHLSAGDGWRPRSLEYCTGAAMEALFKVRYWDYSDKPFNLNGHICLFCSLGWGVFSVLLVKWHPPAH